MSWCYAALDKMDDRQPFCEEIYIINSEMKKKELIFNTVSVEH